MAADLLDSALLVFATIFAFELVDRTNFAVVGLAVRHDPALVWLGAVGAFFVSSMLAVAIGYVLVAVVPAYLAYVKIVGGLVLVVFGVRGWVGRTEEARASARSGGEGEVAPRKVWLAAFSVVLFLEMGDNTQVLTILLVGQTREAVVVFVAAWLALISVAAIGASGGRALRTRVAAERLNRLLSAMLMAVGAFTLALGLLALVRVPLPGWI